MRLLLFLAVLLIVTPVYADTYEVNVLDLWETGDSIEIYFMPNDITDTVTCEIYNSSGELESSQTPVQVGTTVYLYSDIQAGTVGVFLVVLSDDTTGVVSGKTIRVVRRGTKWNEHWLKKLENKMIFQEQLPYRKIEYK